MRSYALTGSCPDIAEFRAGLQNPVSPEETGDDDTEIVQESHPHIGPKTITISRSENDHAGYIVSRLHRNKRARPYGVGLIFKYTPEQSGGHPVVTDTAAMSDPLAQFFDSLDRMQTFNGVNTVLPAHGLAFEDLSGRASDIAQHHRDRLDELRKAGETVGNGTVEDYMKQLFRPRSWGPMAESETYAHLQHLRIRNQAETDHEGTQLRYSIVD